MRISRATPSRRKASTASFPAWNIVSSISAFAFSTADSMLAGWMRPSATRATSAWRAISRRTGLKQETTTASGELSTSRVTPVAASMARTLRPSRPMMRPFSSMLGIGTLLVIDSPAWRAA